MAEVPISCTTWTRRTRHLSIDLAPRGDKPGLAGTALCRSDGKPVRVYTVGTWKHAPDLLALPPCRKCAKAAAKLEAPMAERITSYEATLAAIDDATERRCSQCHKPLPAESVSEWWCGPACQWGWHGADATDPGAVYSRADAAPVFVGRDGARVPLRPAGIRAGFNPGGVLPRPSVSQEELARAAQSGGPTAPGRPGAVGPSTGPGAARVHAVPPGVPGGVPGSRRRGRPGPTHGCHAPRCVPPDDPQTRALEHVRNRNTGPRDSQRAPRRIDPRRNR